MTVETLALGTVVCVFWIGGAIVGGDKVKEAYGEKAGDRFSVIWGAGLPILVLACITFG